MPDDVLLNKAATIERCVARAKEESAEGLAKQGGGGWQAGPGYPCCSLACSASKSQTA